MKHFLKMAENNWENFLKNLGEWRGTFTKIAPQGDILDSTLAIINLEGLENNKLVKFRLRRFGGNSYDETPTQEYEQDYRSLGRQIIFFETGTFSKGAFQLAPFADFGSEFGFIKGDRRLRCVLLYDRQNEFSSITLIREFRSGSNTKEQPQLTIDQLLGKWQGTAYTAYPDLRPTDKMETNLEVKQVDNKTIEQKLSFAGTTLSSTAQIEGNKLIFDKGDIPRQILLLPDGTSTNAPSKLELRKPFFLEVGWLVNENERQRLIRNYDATGAWSSSTLVIEHKIDSAGSCKYLICCHSEGAKKRNAFIVGLISRIRFVGKDDNSGKDRWAIHISEYASVDIPNVWKGWQNPVRYSSLEKLGIDLSGLNFEKIQSTKNLDIPPLSIEQAKEGLAKKFNISLEQIDILIKG